MDSNARPEPDPYEGVGGSYVIDPATGRRVQVVAPPDMPQTARTAAPAAQVAPMPAASAAVVAAVDTSAPEKPAPTGKYAP